MRKSLRVLYKGKEGEMMQKNYLFIFILLVSILLIGCWTSQEEKSVAVEEKESVKPVEIGQPTEKVVEEKEEKEETKKSVEETKAEEVLEKEEAKKEIVKEEEESKPVCEKDVCFGNILQKCLLEKALYNITCPDACKDGKCISKEVAEEEFAFNELYVGKALSGKKQVLAENDLKALSSTRASTANGVTDIKYLIRFGGDNDDKIETGEVFYGKNRAGKIGDYLKYNLGDDIFEYVIDFGRGLESRIGSDNKLNDIIGGKVSFFGMPYQLVNAETDASKKAIFLKFLKGDEITLLEEGASQPFTLGDKEYEVLPTIIDTKNNKVRMSINGKISPDMNVGDVFKADDKFSIAVKEILSNSVGGEEKDLVEFFIGGDQLEFIDNDATNNQFERNVRVDGMPLEHGRAMIRATSMSGNMRIELLKYRADAKGAENDMFISQKEGLRKHSAEASSLLTKNWDLDYEGFDAVEGQPIDLKHRNARTYELSFVNNAGKRYTIPLMDSTNVLKYGDDDQNVVFVEDGNGNIKRDDYFVLTDTNNDRGITMVYQVLSIDKDNKKVQIKDLAGTTRDATYTTDASGIGTGSLSVSGKSYNFIVNASGTVVGFDLNGNGNVGNDRVMIVASGGQMIDLGTVQDISAKSSQDIVFTTLVNKLKDKQSNEEVKVTINKGDEINLQVPDQSTLHLESVGDVMKGMTSYGAIYEITGTRKDLEIIYPSQQKLATVKLKISQ